MPPTIGGVTIDPQGQTLTVTVTPSAKVYTDQAGTSLASFPATITTRTSYWMSSAQQYTISTKTPQGVEIADGVGQPLVLDIQQGVMEGIAPVVDRPGPEDQAQSGTYAPVGQSVVSLFDNGVVGSGDETVAVQAVLDANVGKIVTVPAGRTVQASGLKLASGAILAVAGTLKRYAGSSSELIVNANYATQASIGTDGAMTSGSTTLTMASAPFTAAMATNEQPITVAGAGVGGADLNTTVKTFNGTGSVELACKAGATVSAKTVTVGVRDTDITVMVPPGGVIDGNSSNVTGAVRAFRFDSASRVHLAIHGTIQNTRRAAVIFRQGCIDCTIEDGYTMTNVGDGSIGQCITVFRGCRNISIGTGTMRTPNGANVIGVLVDDGEQGFDTTWPCDGVRIGRPRVFGFYQGVDVEGCKNVVIDAAVDGATVNGVIVQGGIDGQPCENVDIAKTTRITNLAANADGLSISGKNVRDHGATVDGVSGTGRGAVLRGEGALANSAPSSDIEFNTIVKNNAGAEGLRLACTQCDRLTVRGTYSGGPAAAAISAGAGNGGSEWVFDKPSIPTAGQHGISLAPGAGTPIAGLVIDKPRIRNVGTQTANTYDAVNLSGSTGFTKYARVIDANVVDDQGTHTTRNAVTVPSSATVEVSGTVTSGILGSDVSGNPLAPHPFASGLKAPVGRIYTTLSKTGTYTLLTTDPSVVLCSGTWTLTIPGASTAGNGRTWDIYNTGAGTITVTPNAGTINGAASYTLAAGAHIKVISDGTNYFAG